MTGNSPPILGIWLWTGQPRVLVGDCDQVRKAATGYEVESRFCIPMGMGQTKQRDVAIIPSSSPTLGRMLPYSLASITLKHSTQVSSYTLRCGVGHKFQNDLEEDPK